jgi:glutathione-specific gamma-glutamylcyclotransferase
MTLSRRDLEEGRMRALYAATVSAHGTLSDEDLAASLAATIARRPAHAGWWVFAYGSLLWNPLFPFMEARPATVHGVHRRFCLWSKASRGTRDQPGLVLGLEPGGSCRGVVYRLPDAQAHDELALLWRREMVTGAYHPRWMLARCGRRTLTALAFVVDRKHAQYARNLTVEEQAKVLSRAAGALGSSADYLEHTRVALITHGVVDPYLEALAARIAARRR